MSNPLVKMRDSKEKKRPLSTFIDSDSKKVSVEKKLSSISTSSKESQATQINSESSETEDEESGYSASLEEINDQVKRKSWIWEYFKVFLATIKSKDGRTKTEKRVYCQYEKCDHYYKYSGSTSRCAGHLEKKHKLSESTSDTQNQLPKANKEDRDQFNKLILMFIITAGIY